MISNLSKPKILSEAQVKSAVEFHGHPGLFLIIGLRIGQLALRLLDARGYFDISCVAELRWSPPDSCVIDGIQFSTGCTMGKHNIEVVEQEGIAAIFTKEDKSVRIELKPAFLESIHRSLEEGTEEKLVESIITASEEEIFHIK